MRPSCGLTAFAALLFTYCFASKSRNSRALCCVSLQRNIPTLSNLRFALRRPNELTTTTWFRETDAVNAADCERETFQLRDQQDADALRECPVLTGDVVIPSAAEGPIILNGVERIVGSLSNRQCDDCGGITSLDGDTLVNVTGALSLRNMTSLTSVSFQSLQTVGGNINIERLPELTSLNLTMLQSAGSMYLRWNHKLANLSLPRVELITGEEPTIEMVDLAIDNWPTFMVRKPYWEPEPRRIRKLLVRNLPNISRFEFNNADVIDTLEAHGLPHQKAMLHILKSPTRERARDGRADLPADVIHNLILEGFGQNFTVDDQNRELHVDSLTISNSNMTLVALYGITSMKNLTVVDNDIRAFHMPGRLGGMRDLPWENIVFRNNSRIYFGSCCSQPEGEYAGLFPVSGWDWRVNVSTLVVHSCPISGDWL